MFISLNKYRPKTETDKIQKELQLVKIEYLNMYIMNELDSIHICKQYCFIQKYVHIECLQYSQGKYNQTNLLQLHRYTFLLQNSFFSCTLHINSQEHQF